MSIQRQVAATAVATAAATAVEAAGPGQLPHHPGSNHRGERAGGLLRGGRSSGGLLSLLRVRFQGWFSGFG